MVLYKSGNYGEYSQLNTRQCYVAQDIATTSSQVKRHSTQQTQAVDSTRELNSYYVGQVQSSDLPQQSSSDMLPNTGMKDKNFNTNGIISLFYSLLVSLHFTINLYVKCHSSFKIILNGMMLHPDDVLIHRIQSRELFLQYHLHVVKYHLRG